MGTSTVTFADGSCSDIGVAGGKGANLARMTAAQLPVPPGFVVTTDAYAEFVTAGGLEATIAETVAQAGADADAVEAATARLRDAIAGAPLPGAVADAITAAYEALTQPTSSAGTGGGDTYVAVRSSGTAEDLAEASFAGLHDTYLDIRGRAAVLDAVRRCWASMWTARATAYRANKGFDQSAARIAVVVQAMVESEVSGVMFTANPLTAATDEIVVNATWGLGEALVSGIATPDEHILALGDLRVKEQSLGPKEKRVVRDPGAAFGTITEDTPAGYRDRYCLDPARLRELGELGKRVMTYYESLPQDIEWALASGELFLLQSRPATGADFSWDEDLEFWQHFGESDHTLWSRTWSDELWNGGVTPFAYSYRGPMFTEALENNMTLWGMPPLTERAYVYDRGTAYYSANVDKRLVQESALAPFRVGLLAHVPPDEHEQVLAEKMSIRRYLAIHLRILLRGRPVHGAFNYFRTVDDYLENRLAEANGLPYEVLERLGDDELIAYCERLAKIKTKNTEDQWTGFFIFARDSVGMLAGVLATWTDEDPQLLLTDLLTGLPVRTTTSHENAWLWRLSQRIRASDELRVLFEEHGVGYREAFESCEDGREFLEEYDRFVADHSHRGHADRDIYYPRRADDPSIDHQNFATLLAAENPVDPEDRERDVDARRNAKIAEVEAHLRSQLLGGVKARIFKALLSYAHQFFLYRDNQRHNFDRYTYSMKRGVVEIGRRLVDRGQLADVEDAYFLGRSELYPLLRGERQATALDAAKIAGRRKNFMLQLRREATVPKYFRARKPVSFDSGEAGLKGAGTSRGQVTGRARVIISLKEIGQVKEGEILVTNSTDPGWTPVFNLLSGIVLETGGMLAHGSLLAREYGFPAVQISDATKLIPDGALITVNGDTGEVVLVEEIEAAEPVEAY